MTNHYAGVGMRVATPDQLNKCYRVGSYLARHGWTLHTGLAEGADRQFCLGALENKGLVVLHAPFQQYESTWVEGIAKQYPSQLDVQLMAQDDAQALAMVMEYHPVAARLAVNALRHMMCNYRMRVPHHYPPVLLTVVLQGDRPQEQEFGYLLGKGLSIPSVLIRELDPQEIKLQLDRCIKSALTLTPKLPVAQVDSAGTAVSLACWSKQEVPAEISAPVIPPRDDPARLLPVTNSNIVELWGQADELKKKFRAQESTTCPCCGLPVNLRSTSIGPVAARWLIHLVRIYLTNGRDWVVCRQHPELATGGGDYSKPKHWGLIETKALGSGIWRPTAKGIDYIFGTVELADHCLTYNDQVYSFSARTKSIVDILDDAAVHVELINGLGTLAYPEG
jgi:hypothetical protein